MSVEALYVRGVTAEVDLSANRYAVVKIGTDRTTVRPITAALDVPAGILQNGPTIGKPALVVFEGPCQVKLGGAVQRGQRLAFNASGLAVVAVAGQVSFGVAEADGALNEIHTVYVDFNNQIQP